MSKLWGFTSSARGQESTGLCSPCSALALSQEQGWFHLFLSVLFQERDINSLYDVSRMYVDPSEINPSMVQCQPLIYTISWSLDWHGAQSSPPSPFPVPLPLVIIERGNILGNLAKKKFFLEKMIDNMTSSFRQEVNRIPSKCDRASLKFWGLMNHLWATQLLIKSLSNVSCSPAEWVVFINSISFTDLAARTPSHIPSPAAV